MWELPGICLIMSSRICAGPALRWPGVLFLLDSSMCCAEVIFARLSEAFADWLKGFLATGCRVFIPWVLHGMLL
jgi:hypothetical protein